MGIELSSSCQMRGKRRARESSTGGEDLLLRFVSQFE
jgi:hypothetical protein